MQTARQTDHRQTELNNMLVKRSVLNEINKSVHSLKVSRTERKSGYLFYEFPFSLNLGKKPSDAQT